MTNKVHANKDKSLFSVNSLNLKSIAPPLSLDASENKGDKLGARGCVDTLCTQVTFYAYTHLLN